MAFTIRSAPRARRAAEEEVRALPIETSGFLTNATNTANANDVGTAWARAFAANVTTSYDSGLQGSITQAREYATLTTDGRIPTEFTPTQTTTDATHIYRQVDLTNIQSAEELFQRRVTYPIDSDVIDVVDTEDGRVTLHESQEPDPAYDGMSDPLIMARPAVDVRRFNGVSWDHVNFGLVSPKAQKRILDRIYQNGFRLSERHMREMRSAREGKKSPYGLRERGND